MKNKILIVIYLIFLLCFSNTKVFAEDEFSFDVTNIEIFENGKIFKGNDRGTIKSNSGIVLNADNFEYNKNKNILTANGSVVIEDSINNLKLFTDNIIYEKNNEKIITNGNSKAIYNKNKVIEGKLFEYNKKLNSLNARKNVVIKDKLKNYVVEAEEVTYFKNDEKIITSGSTKANINNKYEIKSKDIIFFVAKDVLESNDKTIIKDKKFQVFNLEKFQFSLNNEILKGNKITYITNFGSTKSDKFYFSNGIIDLKNNNFIAKDTLIEVHNDVFGNSENNPRLKGVSSKKKDNITKIKKGVFTSCKTNDNCPPWSIQAEEIIHDKNKKQLIYNKALLKFYDLPILYFPKFFHPDPTIKRQSGFLQPRLNNSNILGNSFSIPYFYAHSENKDFTLLQGF